MRFRWRLSPRPSSRSRPSIQPGARGAGAQARRRSIRKARSGAERSRSLGSTGESRAEATIRYLQRNIETRVNASSARARFAQPSRSACRSERRPVRAPALSARPSGSPQRVVALSRFAEATTGKTRWRKARRSSSRTLRADATGASGMPSTAARRDRAGCRSRG